MSSLPPSLPPSPPTSSIVSPPVPSSPLPHPPLNRYHSSLVPQAPCEALPHSSTSLTLLPTPFNTALTLPSHCSEIFHGSPIKLKTICKHGIWRLHEQATGSHLLLPCRLILCASLRLFTLLPTEIPFDPKDLSQKAPLT